MVPPTGDDWVALSDRALPFDRLTSWPVMPGCGALVVFAGTVRDHAEGRPGVVSLEYEAYAGAAISQMTTIAGELRERWPAIGRLALLHRTGSLAPGEVSVLVAISAPHRPDAFTAARYAIDTIKARVPIWKREKWQGGEAWGLDTHPLEGIGTADMSEYQHQGSGG